MCKVGWKGAIGLIVITILVGGYFLLNHLHSQGNNVTGYGSNVSLSLFAIPPLFWTTIYLALAATPVVFLVSVQEVKRFKFFWLVTFLLILLLVSLGWSIPHGRYLDPLVPLFLIIGFSYSTKNSKMLLLGFGLSCISFPYLAFFWKDLVHLSVYIYLVIGYGMTLLLIVLSYLYLFVEKDKERYTKLLFYSVLLLFLSGVFCGYMDVYHYSNSRYQKSVIGRYILSEGLDNVTFDESCLKGWEKEYSLICFYNGDGLFLANNTDGYFVTPRKLERNILTEQRGYTDQNKTLYLYDKIGGKNANTLV